MGFDLIVANGMIVRLDHSVSFLGSIWISSVQYHVKFWGLLPTKPSLQAAGITLLADRLQRRKLGLM